MMAAKKKTTKKAPAKATKKTAAKKTKPAAAKKATKKPAKKVTKKVVAKKVAKKAASKPAKKTAKKAAPAKSKPTVTVREVTPKAKTAKRIPLRITDTTLRDAHQSLWATRMRTKDILGIIDTIDAAGYYSLEVWGGATFDVCLRFLDFRVRGIFGTVRAAPHHRRSTNFLHGRRRFQSRPGRIQSNFF